MPLALNTARLRRISEVTPGHLIAARGFEKDWVYALAIQGLEQLPDFRSAIFFNVTVRNDRRVAAYIPPDISNDYCVDLGQRAIACTEANARHFTDIPQNGHLIIGEEGLAIRAECGNFHRLIRGYWSVETGQLTNPGSLNAALTTWALGVLDVDSKWTPLVTASPSHLSTLVGR